jgi:FixJ family two-component response regulator
VSAQIRAARLRDIENRQLMAIQRRERAADAELRDLNARLQTLTANEQRVIHELQQHGYLLDHDKTPNHPRA